MEITEQQKDKILKWICRKAGIVKLFLCNGGRLSCQKTFYTTTGLDYSMEYYLFVEEDTISIECSSNNDILEKIIDFSKKDIQYQIAYLEFTISKFYLHLHLLNSLQLKQI